MTLKIKYITETFKEKIKEKTENLKNNFNELAEEKGVKYRIKIQGGYTALYNRFILENYSNQIIPDYDGNFEFSNLLCEEVLEEIKPILEELEEHFIIEIESSEESQ